MYTNKPRSKDRVYDKKKQKTKNSHLKLEITQAFSIVDRKCRQKSITTMTSCNGWKKVREQR